MDIDFKDYQLRCELRGHKDDVRGICVCGNAGIATSSRDRTVRLWSLDPSDDRRYAPEKILLGHTSFVGPVVWIEPDEEFPAGRIVSGGMDTMVLVWDVKTGEKVQTLKGHQLQVTGVAFDNGDIVSSSVDNTLKRWRNGQPVESWEAHKAAVQAVIKLPSGELVTGSSDTTLKIWRGTTCTHTFVGHTDTVRGLAMMSGLGVLSASHDGSIRLWDLTGEILMEMVGHTSIIYSVDSHGSGLIVSSSEDCSAKIWKDGTCIQSLEHPGCVWDAIFLDNGDIVTACSDGVVRIWTVNQDRIADAKDLESYFSQLNQHKISRMRVDGLKMEDLPGLKALQISGTSDGQTKIVREGDNGVVPHGTTCIVIRLSTGVIFAADSRSTITTRFSGTKVEVTGIHSDSNMKLFCITSGVYLATSGSANRTKTLCMHLIRSVITKRCIQIEALRDHAHSFLSNHPVIPPHGGIKIFIGGWSDRTQGYEVYCVQDGSRGPRRLHILFDAIGSGAGHAIDVLSRENIELDMGEMQAGWVAERALLNTILKDPRSGGINRVYFGTRSGWRPLHESHTIHTICSSLEYTYPEEEMYVILLNDDNNDLSEILTSYLLRLGYIVQILCMGAVAGSWFLYRLIFNHVEMAKDFFSRCRLDSRVSKLVRVFTFQVHPSGQDIGFVGFASCELLNKLSRASSILSL